MAKIAYSDTITLSDPIKRDGSENITKVKLRKPRSGELRGLSLTAIMQQDAAVMLKLASRVSEPSLMPHELNDLDPADMMAISAGLLGFFFTPEQRAEIEAMTD